jgi:DNA-binding response OmpR family regulator
MGIHKASILCVEDQLQLCELLALVLGSLGYEVVESYTFADARLKSSTMHFDLYIINSGLPDGSGLELCREIRARNSHSPIIFTSGGDNQNEFSEVKDAGADLILIKPFSLDKLSSIISRFLA